jgi:hypothetical protein
MLPDLYAELAELRADPVHAVLFRNINISTLRNRMASVSGPEFSKYIERISYLSRIADLELTISFLEKKIGYTELKTESEVVGEMKTGMVDADNLQRNENLLEAQGEEQNHIDETDDVNLSYGQKNFLDVDKFFSRPIKISDGVFALSTSTTYSLKVWDLYTLEPSVRAKLKNYSYFRGHLSVRISLTGTPFHYGKILISYQPHANRNSIYDFYTSTPVVGDPWINYLSQSKEAIVMDVRENQPVEMTLPFIFHKPMARLFNTDNNALADTSSYQDIADLGVLVLTTINDPEVVNGTGSDVRYYVYAWVNDIELGPPTGTVCQITTESKVQGRSSQVDEREAGPVERFSSGAREVSEHLAAIPILKPFAKASSLFFGALGGIASIFGWSKPRVIEPPKLVKNYPYQNGANTIGFDTAHKITLDPKQELTVGGQATETEEDEMSFAYLAARPSYLTQFTWAPTDDPMVKIWSCGVTPNLQSYAAVGLADLFVQPTAMSFVAEPFESWHGDIEFTFEFVCSQYHRGKMMILFEPNVAQYTVINTNLCLNKQYSAVIDLQETQTITFCVQWAHWRSWARYARELVYAPYNNSTLGFNLSSSDYTAYNGYIVVAPFNALTSPDDSSIQVNVYVKSTNLMVNRLRDVSFSREIITESEVDTMSISSQTTPCVSLNRSNADSGIICEEHYGERPVSFRSVLKRFTSAEATHSVTVAAATTMRVIQLVDNIMPKMTAYGSTTATRGLFDYLRPAYLGIRGSIRKRFPIINYNRSVVNGPVFVKLNAETASTTIPSLTDISATFTVDSEVPPMGGGVTFNPDSNGGIEVDLPYYSRNFYSYSFAVDGIGTNTGGDCNMEDKWTKDYAVTFYTNYSGDIVTAYVPVLSAAGEDFTMLRFQGAPPFILNSVF